MQLSRRSIVKTGVALAAAANSSWNIISGVGAVEAKSTDIDSLVQVLPLSGDAGLSLLSSAFPSLQSNPLIKTLLPASFVVSNISDSTIINTIGAEMWITSGDTQYCSTKILQVGVGNSSIYSAHRPALPVNSALLVTPFFSITQEAAGSGSTSLTSQLLTGSVEKSYLLKSLTTATNISLTINSLVVNRTELVGSNTRLQMHARVSQAGEHDLANKLRPKINRGASQSEIADLLVGYINEHSFLAIYAPDNQRIYANAKLNYAKVLLTTLKTEPVAFLRSVKASTLQSRVNFTFWRKR